MQDPQSERGAENEICPKPTPLKRYLDVFANFDDFRGRSSRSDYWLFILVQFIALYALSYVGKLLNLPVLAHAYQLVSMLPFIAASIRRMHDSNRSGWWLLAPWLNIFLLAMPGSIFTNSYGAPPSFHSRSQS